LYKEENKVCRKKVYIIVCLLLAAISIFIISSSPLIIVHAANSPGKSTVDMGLAYEEAVALNKLGLFAGVGNGNFALEQTPTRLQGLVMLIRLMGEEEQALNCSYSHPFIDVPAWGDRYVAWAYYKGYTKGTGANIFSSDIPITAQQYLTFILRAMGYGNDKTYDNAFTESQKYGIITQNEYNNNSGFLRADMVHVTYQALKATEASGNIFYMYLVEKGAIDEKTAVSIFDPDEVKNEDNNSGNQNNNPGPGSLWDFLNPTKPNDQTPVTPTKVYSYTNTNNNRSSYTVSIQNNKLVVSGIEKTGLSIEIFLYEVKRVASPVGINDSILVLDETILRPYGNFSKTIDIPDLQYGNYYEFIIRAENLTYMTRALEKIWLKKDSEGWYFEGPVKAASNKALMTAANNMSPSEWLAKRQNKLSGELINKIQNTIKVTPGKSDYETAYEIYEWIVTNIDNKNYSSGLSMTVLDERVADCEGYSNLMIDTLAVYGIPARCVEGRSIFGNPVNNFGGNPDHVWVEFYDSASDRWVVCNPAAGINGPSCWFDLNMDFMALGLETTEYVK